ncbi:MFS transporter [Streptomyces sp. NPDC048106]|uniref:MFS transporter n=1 Tax=Streptomyces sp. NPDC048106 TaxID=3155750 RepID=UPI003453CCD2
MLINPDYRKLWLGQLASQTGDFVFSTTLALWIGTVLLAGRSYAPVAVSGLAVAVAMGTLLVGPPAGVFVDRWDRRRVMMGADLVRAGLTGALTAVAFLPDGTLPDGAVLTAVYTTVFLATGAAQFFNPARFALIGDVVEPGQRARAAGIGQATQAIATIAGPPLAAPLLFTVGARWALLLNAVSFLASFAAVRTVRPARPGVAGKVVPADEVRDWRGEFTAGLRLVVRSRVVTALLVSVSLATVGTSALNSLNVFFVTQNLGVASRWYGTLEMALGFGLVAGALVAATVTDRLGASRVFSAGLVLTGLGVVVYSRLTGLGPALVVLVVVGLPLAGLNTALTPVLLSSVPQSHLGRVVAVLNPVQQLSALVGVSAAGWLAGTALHGLHAEVAGAHFGPIDSVFTSAGLLMVAGGGYAALALRAARAEAAPAAERAATQNETETPTP